MTDAQPSSVPADGPPGASSGGRDARSSTGAVPPAAPPTDHLTADEIVRASGGRALAVSGRPIRGGAVDSRLVRPGNLFVALPGERTDGHRFLREAVAAGAAALVVTRPPDAATLDALGHVTVVAVDDGARALGAIASAWRTRFDPLVVGITGSIAKTSTKEAVATVLAERFRTLRNEGNLNNEIGLPLTVLALGPEHEAAVLEMGMYVGGEIRDLAAIARPRIGVVTAVQAVHLSRIGSIEAIERAKGELVEALPAAADGGIAVLNADDPRVRRMDARTSAATLTYGFAPDADVRATGVESRGLDGMAFTLRTRAGERAAAIPTLGRLSVHNALAAAAVGLAAGLTLDDVVDALAGGWSVAHRVALRRAGGVVLVDDSYNASPGSVAAALDLLAGLPGRGIVVLGEMLELGDGAEEGHRSVGEAAARVADLLVVVGPGEVVTKIADGAAAAGLPNERIVVTPDREAAAGTLQDLLRAGDVALVKASRGIELDRLVDDLVARLEARSAQ